MNTKKISELAETSTLGNDDVLPIVQGGATKKVKFSTLKSKVKYVLPVATASTLGGVKQGANVTIASDGTLSASAAVTVDSSLSSLSTNPVQNKVVKAALNEKQDALLNANGGMALGQNAVCKKSSNDNSAGEGIAIGETSTSVSKGVALGMDAAATSGGGAVGYDTSASGGGAVGSGAGATSGGAVGSKAECNEGGAIGDNANATDGFAGGSGADATSGGAVGLNAQTSDGFAGGKNAKCVSGNTAIDAVQLGTGTNPNVGTMQVYGYQMMAANGIIPADRLPMDIQVLSYSSNNHWSQYDVAEYGGYCGAGTALYINGVTILTVSAQRSVDTLSGYVNLVQGISTLIHKPANDVKVAITSAEGKALYLKVAAADGMITVGRDDGDSWGASVQTIRATVVFAAS